MTASERLVDFLKLKPSSAAVVHDPSNMFYLTEGYTGEGLVLISGERRVILTDFRYTEQAARQAPDFEVLMTDSDHPEKAMLAELAKAWGLTERKMELNYLSVDRFREIRGAVRICFMAETDVFCRGWRIVFQDASGDSITELVQGLFRIAVQTADIGCLCRGNAKNR
jgi:Xaa-Pro aminopeptidase